MSIPHIFSKSPKYPQKICQYSHRPIEQQLSLPQIQLQQQFLQTLTQQDRQYANREYIKHYSQQMSRLSLKLQKLSKVKQRLRSLQTQQLKKVQLSYLQRQKKLKQVENTKHKIQENKKKQIKMNKQLWESKVKNIKGKIKTEIRQRVIKQKKIQEDLQMFWKTKDSGFRKVGATGREAGNSNSHSQSINKNKLQDTRNKLKTQFVSIYNNNDQLYNDKIKQTDIKAININKIISNSSQKISSKQSLRRSSISKENNKSISRINSSSLIHLPNQKPYNNNNNFDNNNNNNNKVSNKSLTLINVHNNIHGNDNINKNKNNNNNNFKLKKITTTKTYNKLNYSMGNMNSYNNDDNKFKNINIMLGHSNIIKNKNRFNTKINKNSVTFLSHHQHQHQQSNLSHSMIQQQLNNQRINQIFQKTMYKMQKISKIRQNTLKRLKQHQNNKSPSKVRKSIDATMYRSWRGKNQRNRFIVKVKGNEEKEKEKDKDKQREREMENLEENDNNKINMNKHAISNKLITPGSTHMSPIKILTQHNKNPRKTMHSNNKKIFSNSMHHTANKYFSLQQQKQKYQSRYPHFNYNNSSSLEQTIQKLKQKQKRQKINKAIKQKIYRIKLQEIQKNQTNRLGG